MSEKVELKLAKCVASRGCRGIEAGECYLIDTEKLSYHYPVYDLVSGDLIGNYAKERFELLPEAEDEECEVKQKQTIRVARVKYVTGSICTGHVYDFLTDLELSEGDHVVAESRYGLGICTVISIRDKEIDEKKADKWIVDKIDMSRHRERVEREEKIKQLREQMEGRRKKLETTRIYELLAQDDSEMSKLLSEYKNLVGGESNEG